MLKLCFKIDAMNLQSNPQKITDSQNIEQLRSKFRMDKAEFEIKQHAMNVDEINLNNILLRLEEDIYFHRARDETHQELVSRQEREFIGMFGCCNLSFNSFNEFYDHKAIYHESEYMQDKLQAIHAFQQREVCSFSQLNDSSKIIKENHSKEFYKKYTGDYSNQRLNLQIVKQRKAVEDQKTSYLKDECYFPNLHNNSQIIKHRKAIEGSKTPNPKNECYFSNQPLSLQSIKHRKALEDLKTPNSRDKCYFPDQPLSLQTLKHRNTIEDPKIPYQRDECFFSNQPLGSQSIKHMKVIEDPKIPVQRDECYFSNQPHIFSSSKQRNVIEDKRRILLDSFKHVHEDIYNNLGVDIIVSRDKPHDTGIKTYKMAVDTKNPCNNSLFFAPNEPDFDGHYRADSRFLNYVAQKENINSNPPQLLCNEASFYKTEGTACLGLQHKQQPPLRCHLSTLKADLSTFNKLNDANIKDNLITINAKYYEEKLKNKAKTISQSDQKFVEESEKRKFNSTIALNLKNCEREKDIFFIKNYKIERNLTDVPKSNETNFNNFNDRLTNTKIEKTNKIKKEKTQKSSQHIRQKIEDPSAEKDSIKKQPKIHRCPLKGCKKEYTSAYGLKYHLNTNHDDIKPPKPFKCEEPGCEKEYKNHNGLKYHLKKRHSVVKNKKQSN